VSELGQNVNDTILLQAFKNRYGSTISAKVVTDPLTRQSKCYGFIKLTSFEEKERALVEMNGVAILGKPIKIRYRFIPDILFLIRYNF